MAGTFLSSQKCGGARLLTKAKAEVLGGPAAVDRCWDFYSSLQKFVLPRVKHGRVPGGRGCSWWRLHHGRDVGAASVGAARVGLWGHADLDFAAKRRVVVVARRATGRRRVWCAVAWWNTHKTDTAVAVMFAGRSACADEVLDALCFTQIGLTIQGGEWRRWR